jgi:NADH-quinone oxidoreductase subunit A
MTTLWPLGIYFAAVLAIAAGMLGLSYVLGGRRHEAAQTPYEGGILPSGFARLRISANFYLVAMFFVIFDLEAAFLYAWAIAAVPIGWAGYIEVLVFVAVLAASLAYLWKVGALDQGTKDVQVPTDRADRRA